MGILMQLLVRIKGLFYIPLVIRFLDEAIRDQEIGTWKLIMSFSPLLVPLISLNLFDGSGMYFSSDTDKISVSKKYSTVLNFSFISYFILIIPIGFGLKMSGDLSPYWLDIILFVTSIFLLKAAMMLLQCYQKAQKIVMIQFGLEYISSFIAIIAVIFFANYRSMLYPIMILNFIFSLVLFRSIFKELNFSLNIDKKFLVKCLIVALPLIPVHVSEWVLNSIGIFQIEAYLGRDMVGKFTYLLSICGIILTIKATLQFFWYSTASNLILNKKMDEFKEIFSFIMDLYIAVIVLSIILVIYFGDYLIVLMVTNDNLELLKNPVIIYTIAYGFLILASIFNGILYALGKTGFILLSYVFSSLALFFSGVYLIPEYGLMGVSLAAVASNIILFFLMAFQSWRSLKVGFIFEFWKILLVSLVFLSASFILNFVFEFEYLVNKLIGLLIVLCFIGSVLYLNSELVIKIKKLLLVRFKKSK